MTELDSAFIRGEPAQIRRSLISGYRPVDAAHPVRVAADGRGFIERDVQPYGGGWRQNGCRGGVREKGRPVAAVDLVACNEAATGVRASIVAMKPRNGGRAKGGRKVDTTGIGNGT